MPNLTQGSNVAVTAGSDSTLTIQSPDGFARVVNALGVTIWEGRKATLDINATTLTIYAVQGNLYYEVSSDPPLGSAAIVVANTAPNITLNDTSGGAGTAATAFGIAATIPGGLMKPNSKLLVDANIDWTGANSKSTIIRIGPASGTFASATAVSGQAGLGAHKFTPVSALICNDGVVTQQVSSPANAVNFVGSSTATVGVVTNIDTAVDWNIYVGVQFTVLNGGDTAKLRNFFALFLP